MLFGSWKRDNLKTKNFVKLIANSIFWQMVHESCSEGDGSVIYDATGH